MNHTDVITRVEKRIRELDGHDCEGIPGHCPICFRIMQEEKKLRKMLRSMEDDKTKTI